MSWCVFPVLILLLLTECADKFNALGVSESPTCTSEDKTCTLKQKRVRNISEASPCVSEGGSGCNSPWTYCEDGVCKCGEIHLAYGILHCSINSSLKLSSCHCYTYNETDGFTAQQRTHSSFFFIRASKLLSAYNNYAILLSQDCIHLQVS